MLCCVILFYVFIKFTSGGCGVGNNSRRALPASMITIQSNVLDNEWVVFSRKRRYSQCSHPRTRIQFVLNRIAMEANRIKKIPGREVMQWDSFILEWNLFIFFYSSDHLSVSYLSLFRSIHRTAFNCFSCFPVFLLKWVNKCVLVRGWVKLSTVHILWCVSIAIWDLLPHTYYTRAHTYTDTHTINITT